MAAFYGGHGIPSKAADKQLQVQSFGNYAKEAVKHEADVLMGNYANQDDAVSNLEILEKRPSSTSGLVNPFVVSMEDYVRYSQTNSACVRVQAARLGQFICFWLVAIIPECS